MSSGWVERLLESKMLRNSRRQMLPEEYMVGQLQTYMHTWN